MINKRLTFEIVSIGLDLLYDRSYGFMTLQLTFFLDASSDKHITFEIIALVRKNFLNLVGNWRGNHVFNWWINLLNSMKKQGGKPGAQLMKNFLNSMRKQGVSIYQITLFQYWNIHLKSYTLACLEWDVSDFFFRKYFVIRLHIRLLSNLYLVLLKGLYKQAVQWMHRKQLSNFYFCFIVV